MTGGRKGRQNGGLKRQRQMECARQEGRQIDRKKERK